MALKVIDCGTDKQKWLGIRKNFITATEMAALVGFGKKSALSVYLEKRGEDMSIEDNPYLRRGRVLEPAVVAEFQAKHPEYRAVRPQGYVIWVDEGRRIAATPDATLYSTVGDKILAGLECKTASDKMWESEWGGGAAPPPHYAFQVQHSLMVTGWPAWWLAGMSVGEWTIEDWYYEPNLDIQAAMQETVDRFWRDFDAGRPPPIQPGKERDALAKMFKEDDGDILTIDGQAEAEIVAALATKQKLAERKSALSADLKALDTEIAQVDDILKARIGNHSGLSVEGFGSVTWKTQKRKGYVVADSVSRVLRLGK